MEYSFRMRKMMAVLLVAVLAFGVLWMPSSAKAAGDNMEMTVEFSPTSLSSSGEVKVRAVVSNRGDDVSNVTVTVGDRQVASWSSFIAGNSDAAEYSYTVKDSEIGSNIPVVLSYEYNGESKKISKSFKVAKKEANVKVSTAVKVDKNVVPKETKVEFTFVVENQGDTTIENCTISAPVLNGGNAVSKAFSVAPGDVKYITYTGTIMKTINVEPTLKYTAAGKNYSRNMESLKVTMSSASLSMAATAESTTIEAGENAKFNLVIKNDGNVDLKNLVVKDASGNTVPLGTSTIKEGATLTADVSDTLTASKTYSFTATCEDDSGETYTFQSNEMEITVEQKEEVDYQKDLLLDVSVDKSSYEQTGKVTFKLVLKNQGEGIFTEVTVSEETLGNLGTYDVLMPGEKDINTEAELSENAVFRFKVSAVDPDGKAITVSSNDVPVEIKEEKKASSGLGTAIWIVVIVFVLMVAAGIALIILVNKEKKNQKSLPPKNSTARPETRRPRVERVAPTPAASPVSERYERPEPKGNFRDFELEAEDEDLEAEQEAAETPREERRPAMRRKVAPKVEPSDFEDRNNF